MTINEIKDLMRNGDVMEASAELERLLADSPDDVEVKMLYGTCCHLLGDDGTFVRIDDEVSRTPGISGNDRWKKYHALRVAACGAFLLLACGVPASASPATVYDAGPYICKTYSTKIIFSPGGGFGSMRNKTVSVNDCRDTKYVLPKCSFYWQGYKFAGWRVTGVCSDGSGDVYAAGTTIHLRDYVYAGGLDDSCQSPLWLTAQWVKDESGGGQSDSDKGFDLYENAQTLNAALFSGSTPVGVLQLKTGRISKAGKVRLSGYVMLADGKKKNFKGVSADGKSGKITETLAVSGSSSSAEIVVEGEEVSGSWNGYTVATAEIGGQLNQSTVFDFGAIPDTIDGYDVQYPNESEPVQMAGKRWNCEKAASMRWVKCPSGADCGYGSWKIDTSRGRTNISGLKLTYNYRAGTFKGSFKVYTWSPRGKKYTVSVSGIVINGVAYGTATIRRPAASWSIKIAP